MRKRIFILNLLTFILGIGLVSISAQAQNEVITLPLLYKVSGQGNVKIQKNIVYKKVGETVLEDAKDHQTHISIYQR
jgi:hypothetical protein